MVEIYQTLREIMAIENIVQLALRSTAVHSLTAVLVLTYCIKWLLHHSQKLTLPVVRLEHGQLMASMENGTAMVGNELGRRANRK